MKNFQPTLEHALYALALALAVGLRFLFLGALPLSDFEADWALQALRVTQGLHPAIGSNPAYVHLTAILFFIFSGTNFLARFWPALAGCALIPAAWLLRGRFGRIPALVLAFGLALDPGLVAMSHLAGGPMLAITCIVLTGLFWLNGQRPFAGFFAGVALLSGPSVWFGLLGLALAWALTTVFSRRPGSLDKKRAEYDQPVGKLEEKAEQKAAQSSGGSPVGKQERISAEISGEEPTVPMTMRLSRADLQGPLAWGLGTLLVLGTLFILSPTGLSAFVVSFVDFLRGWWTLSDVQIWRRSVGFARLRDPAIGVCHRRHGTGDSKARPRLHPSRDLGTGCLGAGDNLPWQADQ